MVVGRRRFTWRDDARGVLTVVVLGLTTIAVSTLLLAATLLATGR
jgi:hypothetical protein